MATSIDIQIEDRASPMVARVGSMDLTKVNSEVGRAVANLVQAHLFALNSERANQLGGKRTNFYSQAAKSTHYAATSESATVSLNQVGFRQRLQGGKIAPVKAKYLTIPVIAEAYGRRAREFSDLQVIYNRQGRPVALAEKSFSRKKSKSKGQTAVQSPIGRVFFLLMQSVNQKADRSVLPTDEKIGAAGVQAVSNFVKRLTGGAAA